MIEIVWKQIETDGNIFNDLPSESIPDFKSTGNAKQDEHLGNAYEKVKDYNNAIKAYQSAFELQKGQPSSPQEYLCAKLSHTENLNNTITK